MTTPTRTITRRSTVIEAERQRRLVEYRRYLMSPAMLRKSMQHLQDLMTHQSPPRLPSRPPTINGRPALRGEIF